MDDLAQNLQESLKISALTKTRLINNHINTITLGPTAQNVPDDKSNEQKNCCEKIEKNETSNQKKNEQTLDSEDSNLWNEKKLFFQSELLRREEVKNANRRRIQLFKEEEDRILYSRKYANQKSRKSLSEHMTIEENNLKRALNSIELKAKAENARLEEFQKLQEQKRSETAQRIQNKHYEKEKRNFEIIASEFVNCYKNIAENCKKYNFLTSIYQENVGKLETWLQKMKEIQLKFHNEDIDGNVIEEASFVLKEIKQLQQSITVAKQQHAEKLKENEKKIEQNENKRKSLSQESAVPQENHNQTTEIATVNKVVTENKNISKTEPQSSSEIEKKKTVTDFPMKEYVSQKSFNTYKNLEQFLKNYESSYKNLLNDEKLKKYRFDCQKAINMPINAITAVSGAHLTDKFNRLSKFLAGETVVFGNVSVKQHPEALAYCMDLLAKKFVHQGDLMVSSNPKSAFAFAAVIVALWTKFPEFGQLVLAHFYRECIYLVPMYLPQAEGQTNEQYYKSLGYRYSDEGVEEQNKFLKRMAGIIRLYSAILVTKQSRAFSNVPNPHGLRYGWRLLSCLLNLEPRIDITATALFNILDVAGNAMLSTYGKQFNKIIIFIYKDYLPRLEKIDSGGPVVRLQVFLNNILKGGNIRPPEGLLPDNFW